MGPEIQRLESEIREFSEKAEKIDAEEDLPSHRVASTPEGEPKPKAQRNFTDPDSRIMIRGGNYLQGYNCQLFRE